MASQPGHDRSAVYPTPSGSLRLLEKPQVGPNHLHAAAVAVDEVARRRAPTEGFDAKAAGAGVEVKHLGVDDLGPEDVEERAAQDGGGGSNLPRRRLEPAPTGAAANYLERHLPAP